VSNLRRPPDNAYPLRRSHVTDQTKPPRPYGPAHRRPYGRQCR